MIPSRRFVDFSWMTLCCLLVAGRKVSSFPVLSSSQSRMSIATSTTTTTTTCLNAAAATTYMEALSIAASEGLGQGQVVEFESASGGGYAGGGGATTSAVVDKLTGTKYFVKAASTYELDMLKAEYYGVKAMSKTNTIQVPTPIAYGQHDRRSFVIFEYLEFCGGGSQYELGVQLAKMHRSTSTKGFGFDVDNTIGATPQPNLPWIDDWSEFWDQHRLGHMLKLTDNAGGLSNDTIQKLRQKTKDLLSHNPTPSLLHGDLWGGNKGYCKNKSSGEVVPVIFDPATYYGDREADIAMTDLFGGFNKDFYDGYNSEWPLPEGHEKRVEVYNLYHILNHDVLFGGMYINQARGMIDRILSS